MPPETAWRQQLALACHGQATTPRKQGGTASQRQGGDTSWEARGPCLPGAGGGGLPGPSLSNLLKAAVPADFEGCRPAKIARLGLAKPSQAPGEFIPPQTHWEWIDLTDTDDAAATPAPPPPAGPEYTAEAAQAFHAQDPQWEQATQALPESTLSLMPSSSEAAVNPAAEVKCQCGIAALQHTFQTNKACYPPEKKHWYMCGYQPQRCHFGKPLLGDEAEQTVGDGCGGGCGGECGGACGAAGRRWRRA